MKKYVFCINCRFFFRGTYTPLEICESPQNKKIYRNYFGTWNKRPNIANKNNNCKWFELKPKKTSILDGLISLFQKNAKP